MILNQEQTKLLKKIVNDKYSIAPFSGMCFNAKMKAPEIPDSEIVKTALNMRLKIEEMAQ